MASKTYDYVLVGGGMAGCTLASSLHKQVPSASILIVEAGNDVSEHPLTQEPFGCFGAHYSDIDWAYSTVPQKHIGNKQMYAAGGKALGGGSATNYGTWTRGNAADYDLWAKLVNDEQWNYASWLPYFRKTETHFATDHVDKEQHGFEGNIHNVSVSASDELRKYPFKESLRKAWKEQGVDYVEDANAGHPRGLGELVEGWRDGKRQLASKAFSLEGVDVVTGQLVRKILLDDNKTAVGIELADGQQFKASKEVIVSAGAYRTPQVLLLSGIGSEEILSQHKIPVLASVPEVGKNFHDHLSFTQWWKVKHPEDGVAAGTPKWQHPAFLKGLPADYLATQQTPTEQLKTALTKDNVDKIESNWLLDPKTVHTETIIIYAPANALLLGVQNVPMDGTHIATVVVGLTPTSTGSISISSDDPAAPPVIDPNYYATEVDRASIRHGARQAMRVLTESTDGKEIIESEALPPNAQPITASSSDSEIDARVALTGASIWHAGGSCAMGAVVDSNLAVKGVKNLRIVDASVLPVPLSAHYQTCIYALALKAADIIAKASK